MDSLVGLNFSWSSLAASFIFGTFGIYFFRHGKKNSHAAILIIGLVLMIYPYFIENLYLLWIIGFGLLGLGYKILNS